MICPRVALAFVVPALLLAPSIGGHEPVVQPLFGLDSPADGPFPSDWFTVPDNRNKTHRRVSLPMPDCEVYVSDCEELAVINELDGFNLQPRLSVPFSGPIDLTTVTSDTLFVISLGSTAPGSDDMRWGTVVGIDQVVWDTLTNTLHVESDALLAEHTRFALIVTRGVRDADGAPIAASDAFRRFRASVREEYKAALVEAMQAAHAIGTPEAHIAVASVFSTQSATPVLEYIRDQVHAATPQPADFMLGTGGERTVFNLDEVTGISWAQQTRVDPPAFAAVALDVAIVKTTYPGAVGGIAFGKFLSPDYQVHPGEYIPPVGTRTGTPAVQGTNEIYFNLFMPSGPTPPSGWPVAIAGHGVNHSKNSHAFNFASSMAKAGVATIAINAVGHGSGPLSTLTVSRAAGDPVTFSEGGRGIDQNGDGRIGTNEGVATPRPRGMVFYTDGFRQTAADLMQLLRVIEVGIDADGDGRRDLDASRVYYFGNSLGGGYGTVFVAVEPHVRAAVFGVPAHPPVIGHLGPQNRSVLGSMLASRQPPSLLNSPGTAVLDGYAVTPPFFDENQPLRQQAPLVVQLADGTTRLVQSPVGNTVAGAMAIQQLLDNYEWVSQAGSPIAYARHLRAAPLTGVPARAVLYQIAKGDETAPNPTTTALLRAGDLRDRTLYYRHDLARLDFPTLPRNPHGFAGGIREYGAIALGAQQQIATLFASDGTSAIQPAPVHYLEFPIVGPLPESLNYRR